MTPYRPIPDLCLISVFKMLTPNDQLKASKMSLRCATLVRVANRQVKTLVISSLEGFYNEAQNKIHSLSLASKPSMKQLKNAGELFSDYPMPTTRLNKWNCLLLYCDELLDPSAIQQIVTVFSAVTDLKYTKCCRISCENLISLLKHSQWADQLTKLEVHGYDWITSADYTLAFRLFTTINALSALQCLAIVWFSDLEMMPDWSILSQLKVVLLDACDDVVLVLLRSLELYAAKNVDLQVHFLSTVNTQSLFGLSEPLHGRIIRYGHHLDFTRDNVPLLCQLFPLLTSLSVSIQLPQIEQLFMALSKLPQLVHLELFLNWLVIKENQPDEQQNLQLFPSSLAQLNTLRALDLNLTITSHSQLPLNFQQTMPHLQALHLKFFYCGSCKINLKDYFQDIASTSSLVTAKCVCDTLSNLLYVNSEQIILGNEEPYTTLEQLLSASQCSSFV